MSAVPKEVTPPPPPKAGFSNLAVQLFNRAYIDEATKRAMIAEHAASSSGVARFSLVELTSDDAGSRAIELVPGEAGKVILPFMVICSCDGMIDADLSLDFGWGTDKDFVKWLSGVAAKGGEEKGSVSTISKGDMVFAREGVLGQPFTVTAPAPVARRAEKEKERIEKEMEQADKKGDSDKVVKLLDSIPELPTLTVVTLYSTM